MWGFYAVRAGLSVVLSMSEDTRAVTVGSARMGEIRKVYYSEIL